MNNLDLRVASCFLATLAFTMAAAPAAAQSDACAAATLISTGTFNGTTTGATLDGSAPCVSVSGPDVWYSLTVTQACPLSIDTCGSSYDTVLSIHSAICPGTSSTVLVCNDDACANFGSRVEMITNANTTYLIRVSGWNGASGDFVLNVACNEFLERDSCSLATPVTVGTVTGSTALATNDGSASCGQSSTAPDHWFVYTPESSCLLNVDTCGSGYDTVLSIHTGCPGTSANQVACNDDSCALGSRVAVPAQAGQDYYIRVAGYNGLSGAYTLTVACEPIVQADDCAGAIELSPGLHIADTSSATPDGSCTCSAGPSPDVWFRYSPLEDCTLSLNTCGEAFDTVLSVHTACPGTAANEIACSDNDCGQQSQLSVATQGGSVYYIRVSGAAGGTGACFVNLACSAGAPVGADIYVGELTEMFQFGREGDTVGCAIDSPLCNAGSEPLDWMSVPDPRHPFMVFNMYRLMDGRFEQIGMSWAKHGWGAAQADACGFGCTPYINNTRLGVGCSDTYSAGANGSQSTLGPRFEVNPWTGSFTFAGSHFATPQPPHNGISHRLQIRDGDLDPAQNAGAQYICETYILAHDDANHLNSLAYEPVAVSGAPGGTWSLDISAAAGSNGPAILAWPGSTRTVIPPEPQDDGRCILAVRVTDNGNGTWHYEYALSNHDMDRAVRGFSIPVDHATGVTNIGFSAVRSHDEPYHNQPWQATRTALAVSWTTDPFAAHLNSNPLRWGTMYNFRFDANRPPHTSDATLVLYKPGTPDSLSGSTIGPRSCPADFDGNGVVAVPDIFAFLSAWFALNPDADYDQDGAVGVPDIFEFLAMWFVGGCE